MKSLSALLLVLLLLACCSRGQELKILPRSSPERQGISSTDLRRFFDEADKLGGMHSVMILRHGHVVAEGWWAPYDAHTRHELYSLSKSFTSTAVGLAVAEGKLSLDDTVLKHFPEDAPAVPSNNLKAMRLRDLLCMSTGHQTEPPRPATGQTWTKAFLAHSVPHKPGTHFLYNTPASYMLSAIVQKVTGQTVHDYLRPRLLDPLGIQDSVWGMSPQGISLGGYGLSVRTEDIARFGQLYLNKGRWKGQQLLPSNWVDLATDKQTSNGSNPQSDWDQGYGFQFWRCRHGCYRGDGAFGQFCIVMPEQDVVVAITSGVKDMQAVMSLVWDKLLPAMKATPLPEDPEGQRKLREKLASLALPVVKEVNGNGLPDSCFGKTYTFNSNDQKIESIRLERLSEGQECVMEIKIEGKEIQRLTFTSGAWRNANIGFGGLPNQSAAVTGGGTANGALVVKVCLVETPFLITYRLTTNDGRLLVDTERNVGFGQLKPKQLVGEVK